MSDAFPQPAAGCVAPLRCSVIVPVYNGADVIGRCLDALAGQSVALDQFEIIVVDDGSLDDTGQRVAQWVSCNPASQVRLVRQPHAGPAAARNQGAAIAQAPLLLFTDADCQPAPGWIQALLNGFAGPQPPAGLMGTYRSDQRALAARFAQLEFEDRYRRMLHQPELDVVATYSAAFRRDVFMQAGGFDPGFPEANNEDVEFSYRLSQAGHTMRFAPEAQVYHQHAQSWPGYVRTKMGRGFWRTVVYRRYPSKALKDSYTPQVLKLEILLAPLVLVGLMWALWRRQPGPLALAAPFLLTTLPFARFAAQRDPVVAAASSWGLWLRSLAFAAGVVRGLLASPHTADPTTNRTERKLT
ncbi:MAG TPA: glycosyltransferase [Anaerolineae bacterium]|nr:glycosyltransferase [Anaerolineae bacterium]